ncbi:MAG: hypothetical protein V1847_00430 [Candidatus Diapherotrites archaeon]
MNEAADLSRDYLKKFLKFAEPALGYFPVVLGGWAVFAFTHVEQSVDADVLLKSKKDIEKLKPFFEENGFEINDDNPDAISFEKSLEEPQELGGIKIESIIFDLITSKESNQLHENKMVEIPWKLAFQYNEKLSVDEQKMLVPSPELLLVYKVKAFMDRKYDKFKFLEHMAHKKVWASRKDFKIEKDKRDIKNLLATGKVNPEKLDQILKKTRFKEKYDDAIKEVLK